MIKKEMKELKAGNNSVKDLEYLKSLSAADIIKPENADLLENWNLLQKTPPKRRNFTFANHNRNKRICDYILQNYPSNRDSENNLVGIPQFPLYAFIRHDKDRIEKSEDLTDLDKGVHYHFYLEYKNARSFASVANELKIPVTLLMQVFNRSGILQYLTHENNPDKHHYSKDEVIANFDFVEEAMDSDEDFMNFARDYWEMRQGKISPLDLINKYKTYIVRHCSYYQRLQLTREIINDSFK